MNYPKNIIETLGNWICNTDSTGYSINCCDKKEYSEKGDCQMAKGAITFIDGRRDYHPKIIARELNMRVKCHEEYSDKICYMSDDLDQKDDWRNPAASRLKKEPIRSSKEFCL